MPILSWLLTWIPTHAHLCPRMWQGQGQNSHVCAANGTKKKQHKIEGTFFLTNIGFLSTRSTQVSSGSGYGYYYDHQWPNFDHFDLNLIFKQ